MRRAAVLLMGPTGSGKSELSLRLAERFPVEIVSVDSAQVYRGMDIGTAKPGAELRARVVHHLIDIRDPVASYSAGEFVRDALATMEGIWSRGRVPLLVGGTMLYFHALTQGIAALPPGDPALRLAIEAEAATRGWDALHRELAAVDPQAARRIHVNDPQRIQRALEVYRLTGVSISTLQGGSQSRLAGVEVQELALAPADRRVLHARIAARFEAMMAQGFLDEVRALYARSDLTREHPSMRAVGYRQIWDHLAGEVSLEEASANAIAATRQLAKRQLTWLRRRLQAQWFDAVHPELASAVCNALTGGVFAEWSQA
jgi:tRNA dimethylallyltransferase